MTCELKKNNELKQISNADLMNELRIRGFYVSSISQVFGADDLDYVVVSTNQPKRPFRFYFEEESDIPNLDREFSL